MLKTITGQSVSIANLKKSIELVTLLAIPLSVEFDTIATIVTLACIIITMQQKHIGFSHWLLSRDLAQMLINQNTPSRNFNRLT